VLRVQFRNYWVYSAGLLIAWLALFGVVALVHHQKLHTFVLVGLGFLIGWISTTIARYVYPPPKHWLKDKNAD
jgi:hypothetical protein